MTLADLRLIHLSCVASLRSAGLLPWLLLAGWLVVASSQEPVFLRGYGLRILDQGAWAAVVVLIAVLTNDPIRRCRRGSVRVACALLQLALLTGLLCVAMIAGDLVAMGRSDVPARVADSASFFVAWGATAISIANLASESRWVGGTLVVTQAALAAAVSTGLSTSGWSAARVATVAFCALAAVLSSGDIRHRLK